MCSSTEYEEPAARAGAFPSPPRPLEALEREITELTSQIHAATCRWLCLIAEYDERGGWGEWGCKSCAHWVSWQCAIAPGPAREHVRVARRLKELPLIRAAFAEGELSYSKVRALTRVGKVEDEQQLLGMARHATASELDRIVRGYHRVVAAQRAAAGESPDRAVWYDHDDDGTFILHARVPAEEGAVILAALEAARDHLASQDRAPDTGDVPAGTRGGTAPAGDGGSDDQDVPAGTRGGTAPAGDGGTDDQTFPRERRRQRSGRRVRMRCWRSRMRSWPATAARGPAPNAIKSSSTSTPRR